MIETETLTPRRTTTYGKSLAKRGRAADGVECAFAECWESRYRPVWIVRDDSGGMKFKLLDTVVLTKDHKEFGLQRGDLGTVVEVYGPGGFEVEFLTASGKTEALVTLTADDLRPVSDSDLSSVRPFTEQSA